MEEDRGTLQTEKEEKQSQTRAIGETNVMKNK